MELLTHVQYDISLGQNALWLTMSVPGCSPVSGRFFAEPIKFSKAADPRVSTPVPPFLGTTLMAVQDGYQPSVEQFIQTIMDEGWRMGIRPRGFQDHTNELTAVRYHLEDMRMLAMGKKAENDAGHPIRPKTTGRPA